MILTYESQDTLVHTSVSAILLCPINNQEIPKTARCVKRIQDLVVALKDQNNQISMSIAEIAKMIDYSTKSVERALNFLVKIGMIIKHKCRGSNNIYTIITADNNTPTTDILSYQTDKMSVVPDHDSFNYINKKNTREAQDSQCANKAITCPSNFQPNDEQKLLAKQYGLDIQKLTKQFILYNQSHQTLIVDWYFWFDGYLDRAIEKQNKPKSSHNPIVIKRKDDFYNGYIHDICKIYFPETKNIGPGKSFTDWRNAHYDMVEEVVINHESRQKNKIDSDIQFNHYDNRKVSSIGELLRGW